MNTIGNFQILNVSHPNLKQVIELDACDFPRPWKKSEWESLNWAHHLLLGWMVESELVGFALLGRVPGDDAAHLLKICLKSELRGSGVAHCFWDSCLSYLKKQEIKSIYLEVEAPNHRAIGFYQKQGFVLLRKIKSYYTDGTDAQTMQLTL